MRRAGHSAVRRGTVIIMVLVLLALGALVVAGLLNRATTRAEQSRARLDHMQARSLAQSGLEGVLAEMATQRARMLAGEAPEVTREWTTPVVGDGGPRVGRVRLVALAKTSEGREVVALSQAACVDVGAMPTESLSKVVGEKAGAAMASARRSRPISSVLGAMNEAGLAADAVAKWEPGEATNAGGAQSDREGGFEDARRGRIERGSPDAGDAGRGSYAFEEQSLLVRDAISVGTFDPIGLWNGEAIVRVDLSGAVDSTEVGEVARQIEEVFGTLGATEATGDVEAEVTGDEGESSFEARLRENAEQQEQQEQQAARVSELMAKVFDSDAPPKKTSELLRAMRQAGAAPSAWRLAWGVRFADDLYSRGRVDINSAPREVLAAIPGIDATAAEAIVSRRGGMSGAALADPTWPSREGIITPEQLEQAADWITTRSMQWRVRIEATVMDAADAEEEVRGERDAQPRRPMGVVTLEVVVDAAAERVRVAYLRDVSLEDAISRMEERRREEEKEAEPEATVEATGGEAEDPAKGEVAGGDDALADLRARSRATTRAERMADRARRDAEGGRVRRGDASATSPPGNRVDGDAGLADASPGRAGSGRESGGEDTAEKPSRPARRELEARDNRTGRWRP